MSATMALYPSLISPNATRMCNTRKASQENKKKMTIERMRLSAQGGCPCRFSVIQAIVIQS